MRQIGGSKRLKDSRERVTEIMNSMKRGYAPVKSLKGGMPQVIARKDR